jgi:hypothetical protein
MQAVCGGRRPGHLLEGNHVGSGSAVGGERVAQTRVGRFANRPEGLPVGPVEEPSDAEVAGVSSLLEVDLDLGLVTAETADRCDEAANRPLDRVRALNANPGLPASELRPRLCEGDQPLAQAVKSSAV